ncbi:MAG: GumC family protein [Puniceicoccaceae bacterium]
MNARNTHLNGRQPQNRQAGGLAPRSPAPAGRSGDPFSMGNPLDMQQIYHFLRIIRERWLWGMVVGLLAAGLFIFISLRKDPIYQADAYLLIEAEAEKVINVEKVIDTELSGFVEAELENHLRKMRSRKFFQTVLKSFGEQESKLILRDYQDEAEPPNLGSIVAGSIQINRQDMLFQIIARHRNPQAAALIANRFMAQYISSTIARSWTGNESARTFLEEQADELRGVIETAEKELTDYRSKHNLVSLEENQNIIVARLKSINAQRTSTRMEQMELEAAVEQVTEAIARSSREASPDASAEGEAKRDGLVRTKADALTEIPFIASYGAISTILSNRKALEAEIAALSLRYLERHPKMVEATERLQQVSDQLGREVDRAVRDLANKKESADRRIARLETELAAAEAEALALDRQAVEYNVLKRQLESDRATFDTIIARLNETNLSGKLDTTNLRILDEAIAPGLPVEPDPPKVFLIAGFLFVIAFGGVPLLIETVDNRLRSAYDVEHFIGKPLLADLPHLKNLDSQEMAPTVILDGSEEVIAEGFRAAYSGMQIHSKADMPKTILVTSTRPSEGKTFVASNLAACMAKHGLRTLLVDCDFRRPTLHRHFELRNDKGILPWIESLGTTDSTPEGTPALSNAEGSTLSNVEGLAIQDLAPNLHFLRAGGSTKKTTELIDSAAFEALFRDLRGQYDVILVDTPPVSIFTDSYFLADFADEIIYVARFNQVSRQKARHFIHKLDANGYHPKVVGVVINGRNSSKGQRYGYDYNYSYYSADYKYYKKYTAEKRDDATEPKAPRSRRSVQS